MASTRDEKYVAGLRRELRGYEMHGKADRAAAVRDELKRLGAESVEEPREATKPPKRTTAAPRSGKQTR